MQVTKFWQRFQTVEISRESHTTSFENAEKSAQVVSKKIKGEYPEMFRKLLSMRKSA